MRGVPWWVVLVAGLVIAALASGAIFYFAIRPQQERIRQLHSQIQQQESIIARRAQAEEDLKRAQEEAQKARARWEVVRRELVPFRLPDFDDPASLWQAVLDFQSESGGYFERDLRKFLAELATECNLELFYTTVPTVQLAALQPTALAGMVRNTYLRWGQMTLQVDGRFNDILRFIERLPYFTRPILVQVPQFQLLPNGKVRAVIPIEVYGLLETHEGKPVTSLLGSVAGTGAPTVGAPMIGGPGMMGPGGPSMGLMGGPSMMGPGGPAMGAMSGPGMGMHGGPEGPPPSEEPRSLGAGIGGGETVE